MRQRTSESIIWRVAAATFAALAFCHGSGIAAVHVTENRPERVSFGYELEGLRIDEVASPAGRYVDIRFDGANTDVGEAGERVLPATAVQVGVPPEGAVRVRFTPRTTRSIVLDAPPRRRPAGYPSSGDTRPVFADPWVSDVRYVRVRGLRIATVVIKPFIYDETTRRLTICTRGVCTFRLPPAGRVGSALPPGSELATVLRRTLLNYEVARRWRTPAARGLRKAVTQALLPGADSYLRFTVGDGHRNGREATTHENGLVRIPGNALVSALGAGGSIGAVELLASPRGELSTTAPSLAEIPAGVAQIPVIRVDIDGDGRLDAEDYLLAYVTGASDWHFDSLPGRIATPEFELNHYDDDRHYWVRYGSAASAMTVDTFQQPPVVPSRDVTYLVKRVMLKESVDLPRGAEGGTEWRWAQLAGGASRTFRLGIDDAAVDSGGALRLHKAPGSGTAIEVTLGGRALCDSCKAENWRRVDSWTDQELVLRGKGVTDTFELESIELEYRIPLDMKNRSRLLAFSPSDTVMIAYRLGGLPDERVYVFRIPRDESAISLVASLPSSREEFRWVDSGGIGVKYHICTESAIRDVSPEAYARRRDQGVVVRDLRAHTGDVDYLIITSRELLDEAVRLAEHKRTSGRFRHAKVVETDDIYREFAGGSPDPTAIRNFLIYAAGRWGTGPDYVVLFGGGHYDFKGYRALEPNHIPPPQFSEKCYDDYYVYLDPDEIPTNSSSTPDVALGRIPCATAAEARAIVDKIIELEAPDADWGAWRNRVLLAADDDMQGLKPDQISPPHYLSSEEVGRVIAEGRDFVEITKVYLYEYEWDDLRQKPEANRTLVNGINGGVACVNYFGHGADQLWADEHIFKNEEVASLRNRGRYPLITSFSCSVGRFDKPGHESLSDVLVRAASAGAIATVSSTRLAYAKENERLAKAFYKYLYEKDTASGEPRSIGQALIAAKLVDNNKNSNQKTYVLLGDPAVRFSSLTDTVSVSIRDDDGKRLDSLKALQTVTIKGAVKSNGHVNTSFGSGDSAYVHLALYNPTMDSVRRKDGGGDNSVVYSMPGTPVFVGRTRVVKGRFDQTILLPKKVMFKVPGVKLVAYASDGARCGGGLIDSLVFDSTAAGKITDTEGPRIMVRPVAADGGGAEPAVGYTDKLVGPLPLGMEIGLYDESGIDVVGTGPDEGLTVEVPTVMSRWNINHKFRFVDGDYRKGTATLSFQEDELEEGTYSMNVTAQDLIGNVSRLTIDLEVVPDNLTDESLTLDHVFAYPNPFRVGEKTRFFFHHTNPYGDEMVTLRIYTLSGKLIKVFRGLRKGQEWRGVDEFGRRLGPNAYLYRVSVQVPGRQEPVESEIKKVVIHPPR